MLGDGFSNPIEHSLQIVKFTSLLYFHKDDFVFAVSSLDIHAIELVIGVILVALALQYLNDVDGLVEEHCDKSFEHAKVSLVAQHAFGSPIKADVFVVVFHIVAFLWQTYKK